MEIDLTSDEIAKICSIIYVYANQHPEQQDKLKKIFDKLYPKIIEAIEVEAKNKT